MSTNLYPLATWPENILQARLPANDNSLRLEAYGRGVISDSTTAQPGSPSDGDVYIIPTGKTGAQWATFTVGDVAIYRGGSWYAFTPVGKPVVNVAGALKSWTGSAWTAFGAGMTNPMTTAGDLIVGGSSGTPQRLAAGTNSYVLTMSSGAPAWAAASGGGTTLYDYTDPAYSYWGPSKIVVQSTTSQITGDPFIVWDGTQFIMYHFVTGSSPTIKVQYKVASTLEGLAAASPVDLTGLTNYHKFAVLVDQDGAPVQIGGNYHAYAVKYLTTIADKEIYHFTATTLTGTWTVGSKVIAKGASGDKDEYNTDTPYAIYDGTTIRLWYMGAPASSLTTYGLAERMLIATATNADGPFTKNATDVMLPNNSATWDYGWLGGVQIRRRPNGKFIMLYNAGNTRPGTAGTEPNNSAIGFAYSSSLDGPWTKDPANPYLAIDNAPTDAVESINVWRGHMAYDPGQRAWLMFYNTGTGTEKITFARQNVLDYWYDNGLADGFNVQAMTTSVVQITNSRVNVTPGSYRISVSVNVMADTAGGTTAKLDIDVKARANGTALPGFGPGIFCGSYAYENRDASVERYVTLGARGYLDATIQVVGGTPIANSKVRRLRITVQRLTP